MSNATGGYQPPTTGLSSDPLASGGSAGGSTTDVAKEQASQVGQTAKDATTQVASTAADQAKNVAGETKRQAKDLIGTAGTQVTEQASTQKDKASGGLRSIGDELRSLAEGQGSQNPMITDLTQQLADKAHEVAAWLDQRDPSTLLEEARNYARRRPGSFLIGAALAGVVAGRLTRGVVAAQSDDSSSNAGIDTWSTATTGTSYGETTFADGSDAFATSGTAFATEAPAVTMPTDTVIVEHDQVSDYAGGSDVERGPRYGEESR